jgi:hypothetical protein
MPIKIAVGAKFGISYENIPHTQTQSVWKLPRHFNLKTGSTYSNHDVLKIKKISRYRILKWRIGHTDFH